MGKHGKHVVCRVVFFYFSPGSAFGRRGYYHRVLLSGRSYPAVTTSLVIQPDRSTPHNHSRHCFLVRFLHTVCTSTSCIVPRVFLCSGFRVKFARSICSSILYRLMFFFLVWCAEFAHALAAPSGVQVRGVRLHVRLRAQEAAPLQELRPPGVLRLRGDVLAEEHAAAHLQR